MIIGSDRFANFNKVRDIPPRAGAPAHERDGRKRDAYEHFCKSYPSTPATFRWVMGDKWDFLDT